MIRSVKVYGSEVCFKMSEWRLGDWERKWVSEPIRVIRDRVGAATVKVCSYRDRRLYLGGECGS